MNNLNNLPFYKLQIRIEALYHLFALLQSKMADSKYRKILFVCRGSTCRSPTAKAILRHLIQEREDRNGWEIESAGTHVVREGLPSNERGLQVLKKHGIVSNHRARQVSEDDFRRFDVMLAFDEGNVRGLNETFKPNDGTARLHFFIK